MKRERIEICWYAVRPVLVYLVLYITIRSILLRLVESYLLGTSADMALYYAGWHDFMNVMIIAAASAGALIPEIRDGQREIILLRRHRESAWINKRKDAKELTAVLPAGTLCLGMLLNIALTWGQTPEPMQKVAVPMAAAVYGLLTPFTEEVLYRGILWHRLRRGFPPLYAALLSALVFGAAHGKIRQGAYAFVMGTVFALAYELTRQFEVPFLLHSACNLMVLASSVFGWTDYLRSPAWLLFMALCAAGTFGYWGKRLRETKFKL